MRFFTFNKPFNIIFYYHLQMNDIMLERLDNNKDARHSSTFSQSREQLNKQQTSPNQEMQNFPNEIETGVNGLNRAEGRHVVTMHKTEKYAIYLHSAID